MQQRQTDRIMGAKQIFTKYFLISSSWRLRGFYVMFTSTSLSFIVAHSGSYLFNHSFIEKKFGFFPSHISFFLSLVPLFSPTVFTSRFYFRSLFLFLPSEHTHWSASSACRIRAIFGYNYAECLLCCCLCVYLIIWEFLWLNCRHISLKLNYSE